MPSNIITTKHGFQTTKNRSIHMKKIKSKNTKPEIIFRKMLWSHGIRYRINYKKIPGAPDIAIVKHKVAIFIDGTFWHGYNWEEKKQRISSNRSYWIAKIEKNIARDKSINFQLNELGWTVLRFWDFEINKKLNYCIDKVLETLK
ncbi:MAG: mismatch endonuclease, patch repair protein [Campylobacterota bacterium]|nr:mismatch endonuclease, patch repair protein [Campylobacterota bacterium]